MKKLLIIIILLGSIISCKKENPKTIQLPQPICKWCEIVSINNDGIIIGDSIQYCDSALITLNMDTVIVGNNIYYRRCK